jgi:cyclophilin family peptidyl-prolyl cis-trans isomerase
MKKTTLLMSAALFACSSFTVLSTFAQTKDQKMTPEKPPAVEKNPVAVLETTMGTIEFELYAKDAPKTVENFIGLAGQHYFDGVKFHRIAKGFVIQGGDPTGTGAGGKSIYGKEFADELNPFTASYKPGYVKGVVAMANRGPNTNTSQFFILLNDATWLPKNYTIFGKVVKGMDVVEKIGNVEIVATSSPNDGRPRQDVVMKKVSVVTPK